MAALTYNDTRIFMEVIPGSGVRAIPVEKDDTATGSLTKLTRTLKIITKYFDSKVETVDSPLSWLVPSSPPKHESAGNS